MEEEEQLVPVFNPALAPLLLRAEQMKGSALVREEVIEIREQAASILMSLQEAQAVEEKRGYRDLDPERCWEEWQEFRLNLLGEDLTTAEPDPEEEAAATDQPRDEPLFMALDTSDPAFLRTIEQARESLDEFRRQIEGCRTSRNVPCLKAWVEDGGHFAFLWLANARPDGDDFLADIFEVPAQFSNLVVGDEIRVAGSELLDWMVNEDGVLHGGYSLRYQRSLLPEERQVWFDGYIGATSYA
jgi:uncharacterized protein YegJ (DUF2314 family)